MRQVLSEQRLSRRFQYFPQFYCRHNPIWRHWFHHAMIIILWNVGWLNNLSSFSPCPHLPTCINTTFFSQSMANSCWHWIVILHSNKRAIGVGLDIGRTTEVLDYSFTSAASDHGYVECTSVFFTAVESQLINFISEPVACIAVITLDGFACLSKVTERASRLRSILEIKLLYTNEM